MKIVKFQGGLSGTDWYWRMVADNGESIAISGEGYRDERDLNHALNLVRANIRMVDVFKSGPFGEILDAKFYQPTQSPLGFSQPAQSALGLLTQFSR